jgi:hypothetical protein
MKARKKPLSPTEFDRADKAADPYDDARILDGLDAIEPPLPRCVNAGNRTLTDEQKRRMRESYSDGTRTEELARRYAVSQVTVQQVCRGVGLSDAGIALTPCSGLSRAALDAMLRGKMR